MKEITSHDTALLGGLLCLGYRPERLQRNSSIPDRIEFVFKHSKALEKDIVDIQNGKTKFVAHELSLELHSVRSRIKLYSVNNK